MISYIKERIKNVSCPSLSLNLGEATDKEERIHGFAEWCDLPELI